jgi:hypothetical protein
MGEIRNAYKVCIGKPERKKAQDNIGKMGK